MKAYQRIFNHHKLIDFVCDQHTINYIVIYVHVVCTVCGMNCTVNFDLYCADQTASYSQSHSHNDQDWMRLLIPPCTVTVCKIIL